MAMWTWPGLQDDCKHDFVASSPVGGSNKLTIVNILSLGI